MDPTVVQTLLRQIERKDLSTAAHTWRVVLYLRIMAEEFGLDHETIRRLTHAAAMHDVGKLDTPDAVLQKPGRLTDREFELIKLHPLSGYVRLTELGVEDPAVLDLVRHHHERWDGAGYPFELAGERIPLAARFFAVIDSFDAMTSIRPYRQQIGDGAAGRAIDELVAGRSTRYCPEAVDAFAALYRAGKLDFVWHYFNEAADLPAFASSDVEALLAPHRRPVGSADVAS